MARKKTVYNNVSVKAVNLNTHNHCINTNQLINGKSFDFLIDGEHYILTPKQVMDYIEKNHRSHVFKRVETIDEVTGEAHSYMSNFYLIADDYIIANAA